MEKSPANTASESVFKTVVPVVFGYIPIAIAFGLLAAQQGIGIGLTLALSVFVYAGASQFIGLALLATGATGFFSVFATVGLINLRHVILTFAYLPATRKWSVMQRLRFFPFLTDETFAILTGTEILKTKPREAWQLLLISYLTWVSGSVVGFYSGELIPDPKKFGLDYALPAMFLGIVILFLKKRSHVVTLVSAVLFSVLFFLMLDLGKNSLLLAAVLGSAMGWLYENRYEVKT